MYDRLRIGCCNQRPVEMALLPLNVIGDATVNVIVNAKEKEWIKKNITAKNVTDKLFITATDVFIRCKKNDYLLTGI